MPTSQGPQFQNRQQQQRRQKRQRNLQRLSAYEKYIEDNQGPSVPIRSRHKKKQHDATLHPDNLQQQHILITKRPQIGGASPVDIFFQYVCEKNEVDVRNLLVSKTLPRMDELTQDSTVLYPTQLVGIQRIPIRCPIQMPSKAKQISIFHAILILKKYLVAFTLIQMGLVNPHCTSFFWCEDKDRWSMYPITSLSAVQYVAQIYATEIKQFMSRSKILENFKTYKITPLPFLDQRLRWVNVSLGLLRYMEEQLSSTRSKNPTQSLVTYLRKWVSS